MLTELFVQNYKGDLSSLRLILHTSHREDTKNRKRIIQSWFALVLIRVIQDHGLALWCPDKNNSTGYFRNEYMYMPLKVQCHEEFAFFRSILC